MLSMEKKEKLIAFMDECTKENVAVAFSGGVDSALLLKLACRSAVKNGTKVYGVTVQTELHPVREAALAEEMAEEMGAKYLLLQGNALQEAGILENPPDRCYRCKRYLFQKIREAADRYHVSTILEGTNQDDLHVYRPGIRALKELGIISPLAEAGFLKEEVRELAKEYGMSAAKKPSAPCLATRFPYGTHLEYGSMRKVETGEEFLREMGLYNVRLRVHDDVARIEVDQEEFPKVLSNREYIADKLKAWGYRYITLDLEGFRSGSMDTGLNADGMRGEGE